MITWQKQGVLFSVPNNRAQSPTAILLGRIIRIYYSSRIEGKSHIYYIDVDAETMDIARYHTMPVLSPGEPGSFDENGCVPGCAKNHDNGVIAIMYTGFSPNSDLSPYRLSILYALSEDYGDTFIKGNRIGEGKKKNNYVVSSPYIFEDEPGVSAFVFISAGTDWHEGTAIYKIPDLPSQPMESTARPAIVKLGDKYCMWFSRRQAEDFRGGKGSYRMGYAESTDLKNWKRDDSKAGIDVGEPGSFDSDMVAYPSIVRVKDRLILFYNGNSFGGSGIGWATAEL